MTEGGRRSARRQLLAVARLELLDGLRGRRQLVVRALTPIVLFGVVLGTTFATRGADPVRTTPYKVAVEGPTAEASATLRELERFRLTFEPSDDAPLAAANTAELGLRVPADLDRRIAAGEAVVLDVYQTSLTSASRAATANLRAGLADIYKKQFEAAAAQHAVEGPGGRASATMFTIDRIDVQLTQQGTRELSAQIVPALLVLQASMLVNATAARILGRRNRGLVMAQLLLPLPRRHLASAKALAELGLGLLAASPVLATIVGYAAISAIPRGVGAMAAAVGTTLLGTVALSLPMVAIGLLIGTAAKSQEQVTLGTAVALVLTATVAAVTALGELPRPRGIALVPIQGLVSAIRDVLNSQGSPVWLAVATASSLLLAAGATRLAGRVYDADRIVLRVAS